MFFKKKRIKRDIPLDLQEEFRKIQENKENEVKYSISASDEVTNKAINEIKNTELKPSFKDLLFQYIDKTGLTDAEVYKKALVSRKVFSKIRTGQTKNVSKNTAICLGIALELELDEFEKLLNSNNTILGDNNYFDIAIKWCIKNKIYDVEQVNDILYACDLELLAK